MTTSLDIGHILADRVKEIETSGIRRVWALSQQCKDPVNLSIGQPDFCVPAALKQSAIKAIEDDHNGYTQTNGIPKLLEMIYARMHDQFGWTFDGDSYHSAMVTSGTAGALTLAYLAILNPSDEIIIPDPYFVIYPTLARLAEAKAVLCDTYPDFRMTAERIEPLITSRTKAVLLNSPSNPTGVVLTQQEVEAIVALCRDKGLLLITDEIYDEFVFPPTQHASPASSTPDVLIIRGFSKTYGCTGWRMGYAVGPRALIDEMSKLQQQTFVCAPSVMQHAMVGAYDIDLKPLIAQFHARREMVINMLCDVADVVIPEGAFYAFPKVPSHLGSGIEFVTNAVEHEVLLIQGGIFSARDTHFRLSFAAPEEKLVRGLSILRSLLS